MEKNYSILHQLRDFTLSLALAFLLFLMFYSIAHLIAPYPKFEDFPCEYNNKHCTEWDKILEKRKSKLKELSLKVDKSPQLAEKLENQIDQLKAEIKDTEIHLKSTREARDKLLKQAQIESKTLHWYAAIALGILALLAGFFIHILPIQIGAILGAISILSSSFITSGFFINNWLKVIFLFIAISLIVAISLKFYKKSE